MKDRLIARQIDIYTDIHTEIGSGRERDKKIQIMSNFFYPQSFFVSPLPLLRQVNQDKRKMPEVTNMSETWQIPAADVSAFH